MDAKPRGVIILNIKKVPKVEAYSVMKDWLVKCDKLVKLIFNPKVKIKEGLKGASKGYFPISMENKLIVG